MAAGTKTLLVSMPFGALDRPALGISLLKACLAAEGQECEVRYLTFPFAELIGVGEYCWIAAELPHTAFAGEWVFAEALYGASPAQERYVAEVLCGTWRLDETALSRLRRARAMVPFFLDHCLTAIPWSEYALVGFTSTFEQNLASLALARRVKEAHPGVRVVFGGGNWEGEMGQELHRLFPFVDYACLGEAEQSFPALVRAVRSRRPSRASLAAIPGLVHRVRGASIYTGPAEVVADLDRLPVPDYGDYFAQLQHSSAANWVVPALLFEGSRGCWWGAKSQCAFCGLNGGTIRFRAKSAPRALAEISSLTDRWGIDTVQAVDNVLAMESFADLLPALARSERPVQLFYEVRPTLTREQVKALREAHVLHVQPGIESMSDHVLRLMRKGTTALQNIQLLKWCREYGVRADWNLLYGFPGETRQDYAEMLHLLRQIRFLNPPLACGPIRLDRFSPHFRSPAQFGLTNLRPIAPYRHLYPFTEASVHNIAYYFSYQYQAEMDPSDAATEVVDYVADWQARPEMGLLQSFQRPDGAMVLLDTRSDAARPEAVLRGLDRAVYEHCDTVRAEAEVVRYVAARAPAAVVAAEDVRAFLQSLVANKLMVTDGRNYLSLAIRADASSSDVGATQSAPARNGAPYASCERG